MVMVLRNVFLSELYPGTPSTSSTSCQVARTLLSSFHSFPFLLFALDASFLRKKINVSVPSDYRSDCWFAG